MTSIIIIRHGETEGNQNKIYRGRWDLPLNENGLSQVAKAGAALQDIAFDAIYTSPLERTRQTAAAVAQFQEVEPQVDDCLIDIDYGQWTKVADSEIARQQPELYQSWKDMPEKVVFPGGEGLAAVRQRVSSGLLRLAEAHPDQTIALCAHRVSVKMILMVGLGLPDAAFWQVQIDTASISALTYTAAKFSLVFSNETCHLKSLEARFKEADF
ncbi:MAG: histidine phosphatase family protein [Deltaproteobacteria bacterium]|nr:histidine phosphatase family protein [Deltaproteobacteria bacterium]